MHFLSIPEIMLIGLGFDGRSPFVIDKNTLMNVRSFLLDYPHPMPAESQTGLHFPADFPMFC